MIGFQHLAQLNEYRWEIPTGYRPEMQAAVHIIASRKQVEAALGDLSLEQAVNAACLPGIAGRVVVMPDVHQGYGFPIGGVAAMLYPGGVISPGAIGYDINCGVRLLSSRVQLGDAEPYLTDLAVLLNQACPSGVGTKGGRNLGEKELEQVCLQGSGWAVKNGYGTSDDARRTEGGGCLEGADPAAVSKRARERGRPQLGTLGAGNHFLEVDLVETIFDSKAAEAMNLEEDCLAVQIHCGSRGFGHQICTDFVQQFQAVSRKYGISLPDRELVCAPLDSPEGRQYLAAMNCAANYAFANRHILAHQVRMAFEQVLAGKVKNAYLQQVYDLAHNIGKLETHSVNGKKQWVCVHRKGATRAFGPGSEGIPSEYQKSGQPVLVPGSMGTASWVLAGTERSMELSFGSCCHGAGRVMSRSQAKHSIRGEALQSRLEKKGILVMAGSMPGLAEEAPEAYKDVDDVVQTVSNAGLARKVARLHPLIVIKG